MQKAADTVIVSAVFLVPEIIVKISQEYRKLTQNCPLVYNRTRKRRNKESAARGNPWRRLNFMRSMKRLLCLALATGTLITAMPIQSMASSDYKYITNQ